MYKQCTERCETRLGELRRAKEGVKNIYETVGQEMPTPLASHDEELLQLSVNIPLPLPRNRSRHVPKSPLEISQAVWWQCSVCCAAVTIAWDLKVGKRFFWYSAAVIFTPVLIPCLLPLLYLLDRNNWSLRSVFRLPDRVFLQDYTSVRENIKMNLNEMKCRVV